VFDDDLLLPPPMDMLESLIEVGLLDLKLKQMTDEQIVDRITKWCVEVDRYEVEVCPGIDPIVSLFFAGMPLDDGARQVLENFLMNVETSLIVGLDGKIYSSLFGNNEFCIT
jgi:hypothetical protein